MKKDINQITEDLMMRYVEDTLTHKEKNDFERILSRNEYLRERVDSLKTLVSEKPQDSISIDAHNDILSRLNIKTDEKPKKVVNLQYLDKIADILTNRPILLASSMACLVIFFMTLSFNNSRLNGVNQPEQSVVLGEDKATEVVDEGESSDFSKDRNKKNQSK